MSPGGLSANHKQNTGIAIGTVAYNMTVPPSARVMIDFRSTGCALSSQRCRVLCAQQSPRITRCAHLAALVDLLKPHQIIRYRGPAHRLGEESGSRDRRSLTIAAVGQRRLRALHVSAFTSLHLSEAEQTSRTDTTRGRHGCMAIDGLGRG
jgi:hypothetical protein